MKTLLCVVGLLLIPFVVNAASDQADTKEYQLPEYKVEELSPPIPTKTVAPKIRRSLIGTEARMLMRINMEGRVIDAHGQRSLDQNIADLSAAMSVALRSWEFEPARDGKGLAVEVKAALPVKVVKKVEGENVYATFDLGKLEIIRRIN